MTREVPYDGLQNVVIPEFQDLGTRVGQQFSAAIAGQKSVDEALEAVPRIRRIRRPHLRMGGLNDDDFATTNPEHQERPRATRTEREEKDR